LAEEVTGRAAEEIEKEREGKESSQDGADMQDTALLAAAQMVQEKIESQKALSSTLEDFINSIDDAIAEKKEIGYGRKIRINTKSSLTFLGMTVVALLLGYKAIGFSQGLLSRFTWQNNFSSLISFNPKSLTALFGGALTGNYLWKQQLIAK